MSDIVDAHLEWMEGEQYSPSTIGDRLKVLNRADRALPHGLFNVCPGEIKIYLSTPTWSRWTAHTYDAHLRGAYAWWYAEGWMSADPMASLKPPPGGLCRPKPVNRDEILRALALSDDPWAIGIILAVGAGLRVSELAEVRRQDVSEEYVHVRRGKGGKERLVDTCASVWAAVRDRPPGLLLRRPHGRTVTGRWLSSAQRRHWCAIGLPQIHWHRLRHLFCTAMLQAGHDSIIIRDLMGHASVLTTQGYALAASSQRRAAVSAIDVLLTGAPANL